MKRVREWRKLGDELLGFYTSRSKLDAIRDEHGSDEEACLKAVIEAFVRGEGHYQPSWRAVIWALYGTGENHIAHDIITYAEPVQGECVCVLVAMWLTSWGCGTRLCVNYSCVYAWAGCVALVTVFVVKLVVLVHVRYVICTRFTACSLF